MRIGIRPFFERRLYRQENDFGHRIVVRKQLSRLNRFANNAVQRFDSVGRINEFSDVLWKVKQGGQIRPMATPGFADLWILGLPGFFQDDLAQVGPRVPLLIGRCVSISAPNAASTVIFLS